MTKFTQTALTAASLSVFGGCLTSLPTLEALNKKEIEAEIKTIGYGHLAARALHIAAYYKLFDTLKDGPCNAAQIAQPQSLDAQAVKRIMRILANHHIVTMDEKGQFSLNDISNLLVSTAEGSLHPSMAKEFNLNRWNAIGHAHIALETGKVPFQELTQQSFYDYLESDKAAGELFNAGMKNFSKFEDEAVAQAFNFSDYQTYCDVGGGSGSLISQVSHLHTKPELILFDLAGPIDQTDLASIKKVKGSFFETVPQADLFTIKRVLHNWSDADSVRILENTRKSLKDKGRILVIEKVLRSVPDGSLLEDTDMLGISLGGQERTQEEFESLGKQAHLTLEKVIPTSAGISILVFKSVI